jgi:ABC-type transport system involved in cytochrome c biogenesis ATPase subunit
MEPNSDLSIKFVQVVERWKKPSEGRCLGVLLYDNWNDYAYRTTFSLTVFDESGKEHEIGGVKIASAGMDNSAPVTDRSYSVSLPSSPFEKLGSQYFSLGMSEEYYGNLGKLSTSLKEAILVALRDMAFDENIWEKFRSEDVTRISLLRGTSENTVKDQYRRILGGGAVLTEFRFQFKVPTPVDGETYDIEFRVDPYSHEPPTNVHAIIGRNGCGKTFLLRHISESMIKASSPFRWEKREDADERESISGMVFVSFSPFDRLHTEIFPGTDTMPFPVSRVSLHERGSNTEVHVKTPDELIEEIVKSVSECAVLDRYERWQKIVGILHSDPGFADHNFAGLELLERRKIRKKRLSELCEGLSSGHKIVLLTLSRLVQSTSEKSLVLIDEPETHLHPPLLSSFVRAVSEIMLDRNGVAIFATHSPVVLQEVAQKCVWKLERFGSTIVAHRPEIETFGENIGVLTREVFGYEVAKSGFHQLLLRAVKECDSFEGVLQRFKNQLGGEAQAIVRGHMARKLKMEGIDDEEA